jgi:hypothetical protein
MIRASAPIVRELLLALLVAGCSMWPSGFTQEQAIQVARDATMVTNPILVDVRAGRLIDLRSDPSTNFGTAEEMERQVWAVTFRGLIDICPPARSGGAQNPCQAQLAMSIVYVDRETGQVTAAETTSVQIR